MVSQVTAQNIFGVVVIAGIIGILTYVGVYTEQRDQKREIAERNLVTVADTNDDGLVSETEWAQVYREVGKEYEFKTQSWRNPLYHLTTEDIELYLDKVSD